MLSALEPTTIYQAQPILISTMVTFPPPSSTLQHQPPTMADPNGTFNAPDGVDTPFNANDNEDFNRWMHPLLLHIIFHGKLPQAPVNPTLRANFRLVLERMVRASLVTLLHIAFNRSAVFQ